MISVDAAYPIMNQARKTYVSNPIIARLFSVPNEVKTIFTFEIALVIPEILIFVRKCKNSFYI